jgi:pimeloyl-ACP methyl ester carboxylesterase
MIGILGAIVLIVCAVAAIAISVPRILTYHRAPSEIHTVECNDRWRIKLFRYTTKAEEAEPILLVHGAMSNHHNWDLPPRHSLVDVLTAEGFDCWAIDLRGCASAVPPPGKGRGDAEIDAYVTQDLPAALDYIRIHTGFARVHWVGHSMGGMLLYAFDCVHGAEWIASGTTLGSPPGFDRVRAVDRPVLLTLGEYALPVLQTLAQNLMLIAYKFKIRQNYAPVNWNNLHPALTGGMMLSMIDIMPARVCRVLLSWVKEKQWKMNDGKSDVLAGLRRLSVPLLAMFGRWDPFVPLETAKEFFEGVPQSDKKLLILSQENGSVENYGHVDLAMAKEGRKEVFAHIIDWIRAHPIMDRVRIEEEDGEEFEVVYPRESVPARSVRAQQKRAVVAFEAEPTELGAREGIDDLPPAEMSERFRSALANAGAALHALLDEQSQDKPATPVTAKLPQRKPAAKPATKKKTEKPTLKKITATSDRAASKKKLAPSKEKRK